MHSCQVILVPCGVRGGGNKSQINLRGPSEQVSKVKLSILETIQRIIDSRNAVKYYLDEWEAQMQNCELNCTIGEVGFDMRVGATGMWGIAECILFQQLRPSVARYVLHCRVFCDIIAL
eukprot:GEZU01008733.1.p1 GENE.GEZU01008733.1~~GEZU01008733.1.p1  ORF type:complete len:119 (-),score=14.07 GEZU01008733.1:106-462(-)